MIASKRQQKAMFLAATAANRAAGAGGGSGFLPMLYLGGGSLQSSDTVTSTTPVAIGTGVSLTFQLPRTCFVFQSCRSISKTAGAGGAFAYVEVFVDGVFTGNAALCDKANGGYTTGGDSGVLTNQPLAAGAHTVDIKVHVDAGQTWTNLATSFQLFQLGA